VYVDDVLALSHQGDRIMKGSEEFYRLKDGYYKPKLYLGAKVKERMFPDQPTERLYNPLVLSRKLLKTLKCFSSAYGL
jgi:hypothetical protein